MRTSLKIFLPIVATAVLISACGSSSNSSTGSQAAAASGSSSSAALVKTASNAKLGGTVLTTAQGMTLYSLSAEKAGKFICTSMTCLGLWHPLVAQSGSTPTGVGRDARHDQATRRHRAGDLQGRTALHVRQGHEPWAGQWPGLQGRRNLVGRDVLEHGLGRTRSVVVFLERRRRRLRVLIQD